MSTVSSVASRSSTDSTRSTITPRIGLAGSEDAREEKFLDFLVAEITTRIDQLVFERENCSTKKISGEINELPAVMSRSKTQLNYTNTHAPNLPLHHQDKALMNNFETETLNISLRLLSAQKSYSFL